MSIECPDCGSQMVKRPSRYGWFLGCTRYPDCRGGHSCDAHGNPLGVPADAETREARRDAHRHFDCLWNGDDTIMSRKEAYKWLRRVMKIKAAEAHISHFDRVQCILLVTYVKRLIGDCDAEPL